MNTKENKTKLKLEKALKKLMLTKSFDRITVDAICIEADINRRTFYRHFKDKYDLLGWIFDNDFTFDFSEHPDWTSGHYFIHFCEVMYKNKDFYREAYKSDGQNGFREHAFKWLYPLLCKDYENCFPSVKIRDQFLSFHMNMVFDSIIDWLSTIPCLPPDVYVRQHGRNWYLFSKRAAELHSHMLLEEDMHYLNEG